MIFHLKPKPSPEKLSRLPVLLCLDDSRLELLAFAHALCKHGYDVIAADNAKEALAALGENRIDAIITDYKMPEMNGGEFAERVRCGACPLPIMLHSGSIEVPDCAIASFDAIVPKGESAHDFLAAVDRFVAWTAMARRWEA